MVIFKDKTIILDASCVISLYASEHMGNILQAIPPDVTVAVYVANKEALYFRGEPDELGERAKIAIDLSTLVRQKLLTLVKEDSEVEANIHLNLATQIRGQGEVTTAAIAIHRGWGIVVDDKRARNLFQTTAPNIQLFYTLDLIRYWTEQVELDRLKIKTLLLRIRHRASFYPKETDPNYGWWQSYFL
jgi:predicted nucleic acid-binding protein